MRNTKEYNVNKIELIDGDIYFIGNDFAIFKDKILSFKRKKINITENNLEDFKKRLDYIIENNLTMKI